jgi:hypothetical protein
MGSHRWKNGLLNTLAMFMLAPTLGACASMKTVEWTEDVKFSDGRMIVVQRASEFRRVMDVGAGFERGWNMEKNGITVEFPSPINRKVSWEGSLYPIVVDVHANNEAYLVCAVVATSSRDEWRIPDHEYYASFRLTTDGWQRISLAELPLSIAPNLLASAYTFFIEQGGASGSRITLQKKHQLDARPTLGKRYKRILRKPEPDA